MPEPTLYMEMSDVARALGLSYSGVYALVMAGRLRPDALSVRGVRYFLPATVEAFRATYKRGHWRRR